MDFSEELCLVITYLYEVQLELAHMALNKNAPDFKTPKQLVAFVQDKLKDCISEEMFDILNILQSEYTEGDKHR